MLSRVLRATPPREPAVGEGRINASASLLNSSMRVLSPKMLPRPSSLLGSIAKTATFFPMAVMYFPKPSIKVLFPTPGTPVMPMRIDFPVIDMLCSNIFCAKAWCSAFVLSTKVMALPKMLMSPLASP